MEAPMKRWHFIGADTHCPHCDVAAVNAAGQVVQRQHCETTIPALLQVIDQVPRPRALVIEEGPLAGWYGGACTALSTAWWSVSQGAIA
jgi:hypothetical protein